jgi:adenylate cyclase
VTRSRRELTSTRGHRLNRRRNVPIILHCLLVALVAGLALWRPAVVEDNVENLLVDWRFKARNRYWPPAVPQNIMIVAVDEPSIARYGSWPWPPTRIAELIEKVARGKPRAVGIEPFLYEQESPWGDRRIAEAISLVGQRAATGIEFQLGGRFAGAVPERLLEAAIRQVDKPAHVRPMEASRALLRPESLAASVAYGHANYEMDRNEKVRRERLYLRYGDAWIPSLALQTARIAAGLAPRAVRIRGDGVVEFGDTMIPADLHGQLLINYYGDEGWLPRRSAGAILSGDTPPGDFADEVVFIGTTGIAAYDLVSTPFGEKNMPGVERNATVAANILGRNFLRDAPLAVDLLIVLAAGAAVPLLCRRRRAALSLLCFAGLTLFLTGLNFAFFLRGVRMTLSYPLFLVLFQGGMIVPRQLLQDLVEARVARRIRRLFSSYVTERVVERLIADPKMARLGGERREVTILFSDIRGFTSYSEKTPPEEVVRTLNEYLEAMTEVIFRWEGTLDKFMGDTILAFWGAPLPQDDHAERALRCALHMCSRLDQLNAAWAAAGRPALEIGVGITTGTVLVGNIGAEGKKMDYTVIGDQVNLCSRVEELTKTYQSRILLTASTLERLRPLFARKCFGHLAVTGLAEVLVKGKEEAVGIYRVSAKEHGGSVEIEDIGAAAAGN